MKESAKIRSDAESYSVSEAARMLGVSIPTLKRMAADGHVEGFRTPGGHLRITVESIEALREQRQVRERPVREASPVLQNRRERLEELTLEAQEHRAKRELEKLRREEREEVERREAEAEAREQEAAQRQANIELERERLGREQAQERQRREAERELAAFRCRWLDKATEAISARPYAWLTAAQRTGILDGLETEIHKRQPADEPRMAAILARNLETLCEPLRGEHELQERRQRLTERALCSLPYSATEADKVRATATIREALQRFDGFADICEMRVAAQEAIQPVCQAVEKRSLDARLLSCAIHELPWSRTERDEARIRRECTEILAELPVDVTEVEGKEALEATVREACAEIEQRQAEKDRQARKASLIQQGLAEVSSYVSELRREGEISDEEYWDSDFTADLRDAVRHELEAELSGDETTQEVGELARETIDEQLE